MRNDIFDLGATSASSSRVSSIADLGVSPRLNLTRTIAAAILSVVILSGIAWVAPVVALAITGAAALAVMLSAVRFILAKPLYLMFVLAVLEEVPSLFPLSDNLRAAMRYGMYAMLLIPAVPMALRSRLVGRGCFRLYAIYFAWAVFTTVYSIAPVYTAARALGASLSFLAIIAAIAQVDDETRVDQALFLTFMGFSALVILLALAAVVLPTSVTWSHPTPGDPESYGVSRFMGVFDNPNQVGQVTLAAIATGLVCLPRVDGWRRRWTALTIAIAAVLTLMADSRSVFVALGIGAACYGIWRYKMRGVLVTLLLLAGAAAAARFLNSDYFFRGAGTLTGRTEIWHFTIGRLMARPILGYGYSVDGAIFDSRYFPLWWGPWSEGPRSSLHNAYLSRAIGVGIPFTLLWLYLTLKPFASVFRSHSDPWRLKVCFWIVIVPMLVRSMVEADVSDCVFPAGIAMAVVWALAERERLNVADRHRDERAARRTTPIAAALASSLAVIAIVGVCASSPSASTYYVDPAGNDDSAGTSIAMPWRSLAKVNHSVFQPGDTIALKAGGVWRETLAPLSSGTPNAPITFARYGAGPMPIISGSDVVSRWNKADSWTWSAPLAAAPNNVYVDDAEGWGLPLADSPEAMPPGSWCWRRGILYVRLARDDSPAAHTIEAAVREDGVIVDGGHWNNNGVASLTLTYSGGNGGRSGTVASHIGYIVIDGLEVERTGGWGIHFYDSTAPTINNCIVHETGSANRDIKYYNAIHVDIAPGATFEHNRVAYSGGHGNSINCQRADRARVINNHVSNWNHNGLDTKESSGVLVGGNIAENSTQGSGVYGEFDAHLQVINNTIRDVTTGVQVNLGTSARISGNTIAGASTAIYLGPRGASAEVTNNCSRQCRFALIDAGQDSFSEDYNRWNVGSLIKMNGQIFDDLTARRRAGFGLHDYSADASDNCQ